MLRGRDCGRPGRWMKLAAAVKYSRGARNTDPPEIVEEGDGSFRYVTLAAFRGEGRRREEYVLPAATENGVPAGAVVR